MDTSRIETAIAESIATKERLLRDHVGEVAGFARAGVDCIARGGKIMLCGNGGSACDAAHAVGELVGWFERKQRPPFAAIALGHEVPTLTAIANDVGFEEVFARQVRALGRPDDLLIGISTSAASRNVVAALEAARELGIPTAALVGARPGPVVDLADVAVRVPAENTARIQECHLVCLHVLCAEIEGSETP